MTRSRVVAIFVLIAFIGASIAAYLITLPDTVPDKLEAWLPGDCAQDNDPVGLARHDFGLSTRAALSIVQFTVIHCDDDTLGPATRYLRFDSHRALIRALAATPSGRPRRFCVLGNEAFDAFFLEPQQFKDPCDRLDGRFMVLG